MSISKQERAKHQQELACASAFVDWLSSREQDRYSLQRAEEAFPDLKGRLRWEFVARGCDPARWLAIEVKGLRVSELGRGFSDWNKRLVRVTKMLGDGLKGTFAIILPPPLSLNQNKGGELEEAIAESLRQVVSTMQEGDTRDIGAQIKKLFGDWPTEEPYFDFGQRKVMYPPHELKVFKQSDDGQSVFLGVGPVHTFAVDPFLKGAVGKIFTSPAGRAATPSRQLGLAKKKGAMRTVLLLDSHIGWEPDPVAQALREVEPRHLDGIDSIYLVSISEKAVAHLWP